jgi:uncharacterized Tic20 family protein
MSFVPNNANIQPPPDKPPYVPTQDERTWALLAHLSGLIAGMFAVPFVGPLIVWVIKKDESPFVGDQAKEALNFQIALLIAVVVCIATCVGIVLAPIVGIAGLVYSILGALEANKGVYYRYPYTLRLIK